MSWFICCVMFVDRFYNEIILVDLEKQIIEKELEFVFCVNFLMVMRMLASISMFCCELTGKAFSKRFENV